MLFPLDACHFSRLIKKMTVADFGEEERVFFLVKRRKSKFDITKRGNFVYNSDINDELQYNPNFLGYKVKF